MSEQARRLRRFVQRTPTAAAPGPTNTFVVAAGKGGVGTSTAALLLAMASLRSGPVTLVDAHEGLAGVDQVLGVDGIDPGRQGSERVEATRRELVPGLDLVQVPGDDLASGGSAAWRAALRQGARSANHDGTIIVDAGARPAGVVHALTDFDAALVVVLGSDAVSVLAGYALNKLVVHRRPATRLTALVNRSDHAMARLTYESVRSATDQYLGRPVEWLGHLPDTPGLEALDLDGWLRLDEHAPAVMNAALEAATRLRPRPATVPIRSLSLLK